MSTGSAYSCATARAHSCGALASPSLMSASTLLPFRHSLWTPQSSEATARISLHSSLAEPPPMWEPLRGGDCLLLTHAMGGWGRGSMAVCSLPTELHQWQGFRLGPAPAEANGRFAEGPNGSHGGLLVWRKALGESPG